ncbi:MAG TPA: undecaprenyl-diphosphate phosphatase [Gemmatimonadota bacterium]|nr:undecaprenyl-diphosphate phosphatase [Gemmatimonadota bacterium]
MSPLEGALLGFVQGLTEFLPVSSSGHLVIVQTLLGLDGSNLVFDVVVHGATLAAIGVWFRRRLLGLVAAREWTYAGKLAVASLPVALVGGLFAEQVEAAFAAPELVVGTLALTGAALFSLYLRPDTGTSAAGLAQPGWAAALVIGAAQALAILPGISRSGLTIVAGLWLGLAPAAAAEFSFLLGIPAIAGAVVYQLRPTLAAAGGGQGAELLVGAAVAFASGLAAISLVFRLLTRRGFRRFGFYCCSVAIAFAAWLAWGNG